MDLRDGDLVFGVDLQVVDGALGPVSVQKTLSAGFEACDAALPKVCRVAFADEAPEEVLERGGTPVAGGFEGGAPDSDGVGADLLQGEEVGRELVEPREERAVEAEASAGDVEG